MTTTRSARQFVTLLLTILVATSMVGIGVGTAQENDGSGIDFRNQVTDGDTVTVSSATLPEGGFVGIVDTNGLLIGVSSYFSAGSHSDIQVTLDNPLDEGAELDTDLQAVALFDADGNQQYDGPRDPTEQLMTDDAGQPITDTAIVTVGEQPTGVTDTGQANFQIQAVSTDADAGQNTANISAVIENVGNATGTQNITYSLEGESVTTGASAVDIVFVLDQSGSMTDDNEIVRRELRNFTTRLETENVDVRYGVVEMERPASVLQNFTTDVNVTRSAIEQVLTAGGGTEDNFAALALAQDQFQQEGRPNAQQIIIDITDEGSNVAEPSQEELAERFNQTNTSYIAVTPASNQSTMAGYPPEVEKRPLANLTERGTWFNLLEGDFGQQFTNEIASEVVNISRQNQQEVTLAPGENTTVSFSANTTDLPAETYAVTVETANDTAATNLTVEDS